MLNLVLSVIAPPDDAAEPKLNDNLVKFSHPDLDLEGQWNHLVLVFNRAGIMKNSSVTLYLDGEVISVQKVCSEMIIFDHLLLEKKQLLPKVLECSCPSIKKGLL